MVANIFGERFLSHRQPAWHGLGTVFQDPISAVDAIAKARLDYKVETFPLVVEAFGQKVETDQVAIVREPVADDKQPRLFGIAGKDYTVLQNTEIAEALDPLTKEWPVETVGALGNGERIFISLAVGNNAIAGDEIREYFLFTEGKTGGNAAKLVYTPVRVVCQNTLVTGLRSATMTASIAHHKSVKDMVSWRANLMAQMRKAQTATNQVFEMLTTVKLGLEQTNSVIVEAFPFPKPPTGSRLLKELSEYQTLTIDNSMVERMTNSDKAYTNYCERVKLFRSGALELLAKFNDEHPQFAETAWAVYNACVECSDYRRGTDSVAESALWGGRAQEKARAFAAVTEAAGLKVAN